MRMYMYVASSTTSCTDRYAAKREVLTRYFPTIFKSDPVEIQ
jgi:hypothetical protein